MKRIKMNRSKYIVAFAVLFVILSILPVSGPQAADMTDYCMVPPYVKRDVKPNIMIMMDNATDMGEPAYCTKSATFTTSRLCMDNYDRLTKYEGYFKPGLKYNYSGNQFVPSSTGIYSGNFLNWATTSKYDLLQLVLVGGISTSRQTNVNSLVSRSTNWVKAITYRYWDNSTASLKLSVCSIFVNSANVVFKDHPSFMQYPCGLLDTPIHTIYADPLVASLPSSNMFLALESGGEKLASRNRSNTSNVSNDSVNDPVNDPVKPKSVHFLSAVWSAVVDFLIPTADAASPLRIGGGPSTLSAGTVCTPYSPFTLSAAGGSDSGYAWSWIASAPSTTTPPGLTLGASGTPSTTISGTPTASGAYTFTVTVTDSAGNMDSKSYSISISPTTFEITTMSPLPNAIVGIAYDTTIATNGACGTSASHYYWHLPWYSSLPPGLTILAANSYPYMILSGTPSVQGTYTFTIKVYSSLFKNSVEKIFTLTVVNPSNKPIITTSSPLPDAALNSSYSFTLEAIGGSLPYTWLLESGALPPGTALDGPTGIISGTPTTAATYTFSVSVTESGANKSDIKTFTLKVAALSARTGSNMNVKVCTGNYTYNCNTALPSTYPWPANSGCSESNHTTCILKSGLIDEFWTQARFGVMDFSKAAAIHADPNITNCIEQDPGTEPDSNFLTAIENSVSIDPVTTLVAGEHKAITYYMTETGDNNNCNPFVNTQKCSKNFVLSITGGTGAENPPNPDASPTYSPYLFSSGVPTACTSASLTNLAKNSCYGFQHSDLRSDVPGRQYVTTYFVNTFGTPTMSLTYDPNTAPGTGQTGNILYQAAVKGGGAYYEVTNATQLKAQLKKAFEDIIKRAAAGTAASVLASGEGSGANLVQAVFYPRRQFGNTEIDWIGRLTNLWYYVDPFFNNSNIREDDGDKVLTLKTDLSHQDNIAQLYFDTTTETTKAHRWTDTNGDAVVDGVLPDLEFESMGNLWEAGKLLWSRNLSSSPRTIYTAIGSSLISFSSATATATTLRPYLDVADDETASKVINYVHGVDYLDYRPRSVSIDGVGPYTWKLGDVLNSTPKIASWLPLNMYHKLYRDDSYGVPMQDPSLQLPADNSKYITSDNYRSRGVIFAGANDGMLHAFKLGSLELKWTGQGEFDKARLTGSDLGQELWAFIPKNVLPYLKYLADPNYCHVYSVDLTPYVFDASIGGISLGDVSGTDRDVTHWRTVLIGGMRYGGACRKTGSACNSGSDCVNTPLIDPGDSSKGLGYSSYFALDITNVNSPQLLWEFNHEELGFATAGPAIVRVSVKDASNNPLPQKNGKWFVVLASGPTGSVHKPTKQFMGASDQNLKLFVLDLKTGALLTDPPIDTGEQLAFAGSMINSTFDADLDYQDDVVYIPYVQKDASLSTWTSGGVIRLSTKESTDPGTWEASTLINGGVGPATSAVAKLQNRNTNTLWVYFGTGRYFFEQGAVTDDADGKRQIFGIKDPCYTPTGFDGTCTASVAFCATPGGADPFLPATCGDLRNVTDIGNIAPDPTHPDYKGWYINLNYSEDPNVAGSIYRAERVITDPLAASTGVVFFTTYTPYLDECSLGGVSSIWAVKYDTGGSAGGLLKGKALVQVSTGSIEQIDLSSAFTQKQGRKSFGMVGVPPTAQGLSVIVGPPAQKKILHIKER